MADDPRPDNVATDLRAVPGPISLQITPLTGVGTGRRGQGVKAQDLTGFVWQASNSGFAILRGAADAPTLTLVPINRPPGPRAVVGQPRRTLLPRAGR